MIVQILYVIVSFSFDFRNNRQVHFVISEATLNHNRWSSVQITTLFLKGQYVSRQIYNMG